MRVKDFLNEKWSQKYKRSINCAHPKGFSQRAHCQGRKKHNEDLNEKTNRTGSSELVIFDIDDTLLHTTAKINVVKDGKVVKTLTNQEFNNYKLQPGEDFDFGEFRNAKKFEQESVPIEPMLDKLRSDVAAGKNVVMLTARADMDDKNTIFDFFKSHGVDIKRDVHLYRAGNMPGNESPALKKARYVTDWLDSGKFNKVTMYDDSLKNLAVFKSLVKHFPEVEFNANHVSEKGTATQLEYKLEEDLRKWFKEKWVRFNPQGKIMGPCARGSSKEGKPKCLPQSKAHALGKKGRASAARRKRREDPNPERKGPAKNVATKKKE